MNEQEIKEMVVDNFILYFTSDDKERVQMQIAAKTFFEEVEEPIKVSSCCGASLRYGVARIGGLIRCEKCGLFCEEVDQ